MKSQISSTKLQINPKFQYSITKTFTTVVSHRFANSALPVMIEWARLSTDYLFGILNLGHWNLFEIWFLVLGISMVFTKQIIFVKSVNYLFK
jgi:hypothetical protein